MNTPMSLGSHPEQADTSQVLTLEGRDIHGAFPVCSAAVQLAGPASTWSTATVQESNLSFRKERARRQGPRFHVCQLISH